MAHSFCMRYNIVAKRIIIIEIVVFNNLKLYQLFYL